MKALAEEWKKRDREREVLMKKKVRFIVVFICSGHFVNRTPSLIPTIGVPMALENDEKKLHPWNSHGI